MDPLYHGTPPRNREEMMMVQREVHDPILARVLETLGERELTQALDPYLKKEQELIQIGKPGKFESFTPIKPRGEGPSLAEMVIRDRT